MENSKAIATVGVSYVVGELSKFGEFRAYVWIIRGACRVFLGIKPVAIVVRSSSMIASEDVVWVGDPEASRGLIGVEQAPGLPSVDREVAFQIVISLHCILNEESVTHRVVSDIMHDSEVEDSVNGAGTVVGLMNRVAPNV